MATKKTEAETTEATEATPKTDGRSIILTLNEEAAELYGGNVGDQVKRVDFIRKLWSENRMSRSEIAKATSNVQGVKVIYQIVFQATKGIDGGPVKEAKPEEEGFEED